MKPSNMKHMLLELQLIYGEEKQKSFYEIAPWEILKFVEQYLMFKVKCPIRNNNATRHQNNHWRIDY